VLGSSLCSRKEAPEGMKKPFHVMIKPSGANCNLACEYCYYLPKKEFNSHRSSYVMDTQVLGEFTRQYLESQGDGEIIFSWQGGEPTLLGIDFFRQALSFQEKFKRPAQLVTNTIQTNGTLIDSRWCAFLRENNFLVGLSVDGPSELHDVFRRTSNKAPTFDRVYSSLQILKRHGVEFNVLCVVSRANVANPEKIYKFFIKEAVHFIQFIPAASHLTGNEATFGISGAEWGSFLCKVFDQWVKQDVGKTFVMNFEEILAAWCEIEPSICTHKCNCGQTLVLEHNGDVYSCDFFVDAAHRLGNIMQTSMATLANLPVQVAFGSRKVECLPEECLPCPALFTCNGGCLADRIKENESDVIIRNRLCEGHKMFFEHTQGHMQEMASMLKNSIPVENIMKI
jgi:uncharacterized protein